MLLLLNVIHSVLTHFRSVFVDSDNSFEFWFNGEFIEHDELSFSPHQAVAVSFEWDGQSDKVYSILCQDYMNEEFNTGFEYVEVPLWIDGQCCFLNRTSLVFDNCTAETESRMPNQLSTKHWRGVLGASWWPRSVGSMCGGSYASL